MTKRTRTCLFLICAFLFLVTAPSLLLYSQGYRIDFENREIVKTGGLYFKVLPKEAKIFINDKLVKKTDFFFGSAFIENLLPRKYLVEITKSGYQSWKKNLEVKEAQVTEAKNIVLVPEKLELKLLDNEVKDFFPSPDGKTLIFKKESFENEKVHWDLKLYDPGKGIKSHLISQEQISQNGATFSNLVWSSDGKRIIIKIEIENEKKYFLLDLAQAEIKPKELKMLDEVEEIAFNPAVSTKILFSKIYQLQSSKENYLGLFEQEIESENANLLLDNIAAWTTIQNDIFWLSGDGFLQKTDLSLLPQNNIQQVSLTPIPLKEGGKYLLNVINSKIFLKENETFFFFDENTRSFEEIGSKISSIKISPDSEKLCFWNDFEIWILFLKQSLGQPQREARSKLFLTRFSKKIENVFWWNNNYLIFNTNSEIKVMETDNRDDVQIWSLSNLDGMKIYFNSKDRKLYVLSRDSLFVSESLI